MKNISILFYKYLQIMFSPSQYTFQLFKLLIVGESFNYLPEINLRLADLFASPGLIQLFRKNTGNRLQVQHF